MNGLAPIGAIVGWLKSFTNVPSLTNQGRNDWVEVNGATISDTESPINGQTLPDLNGITIASKFFLRGNTTSGGTANDSSHIHAVQCSSGTFDCDCACTYFYAVDEFLPTQEENIPVSYECVWIIRIK